MQLALVGAAHIHTPGFSNTLKKRGDEFAVKYVWDHDAARATANAENLGARVADLETIWTDPEVAAAIICSETNRHEKLVLAGAAAKKHLFVEKPLGMAAADAGMMARAIEEAGVLFQTGYFMRGNPAYRFVREQIERGAFGKITRIRMSNCHTGSLGGWFDTDWRWMADPAIAGVGAFGDLGTHVLDIMLWMLGDVTSATARTQVVTGRYGDCDETGEGMMVFNNGVIGTLNAGWVDIANPMPLLISGTEGHAYLLHNQLYIKSEHLDGADGNTPWTALPSPVSSGFDLFLNALLGKADAPLVTAREAAYRSTVMAAMYQGAATDTWVTITG